MDIQTLAANSNDVNHIYPFIDLVLGGVFVLFYAGTRFNTPTTNRSSTTAARYFLGLFLYCLVSISVYALLVVFPHLLGPAQLGQQIGTDSALNKISLPLFVALLLTVLLPRIPILSSAEKWVLKQLKDVSNIPGEVLWLSAELQKDDLSISIEEHEEVRQQLENDGFDPKDIVFEHDKSPMSVWTNLTLLFQKVEAWKSDRRMAGYIASSQMELQNLRDRKQFLLSKAKTCFHLLNEDIQGHATRRTHEATVRYREDFTERADQLTKDVFDFIARGVLRAELTDGAREHRLKAMGFSLPWPDEFSLNELLLLFGVVCVVMMSGFVLFGAAFTEQRFEAKLIRAIMISLIYSVAVACAVLPKTRWSFARTEVGEVRPIGFYLVAGLMSAAISYLTGLFFNLLLMMLRFDNLLLMERFHLALQRSGLTYPWLLVSFATALITAMMIDNPQLQTMSPKRQRCLEGLAQGVLMLVVTSLTYMWLRQRVYVDFKGVDLKSLDYDLPPLIMIVVMGTIVGFVIGFFIPTWYRRHQKQSEEQGVRSLTLAGSATTEPTRRILSA